jgi:HEAT repeat protein
VAPLLDTLRDANFNVREGVAGALASFHEDAVIQARNGALTDKNSYVRISVIRALDRLGDRRSLAALDRMESDANFKVRQAASHASVSIRRRGWDSHVRAAIVLEGLQGKPVPGLREAYGIDADHYRRWRSEFLTNAYRAFERR